MEVLIGVPDNLQQPYADFSGWFACGCVVVLVAVLATTVAITIVLVQQLLGRPYRELSSRERSALVPRFEHKVSDHLPLWIRLPLPTR